MKVSILRTHSDDCENKYLSLMCLGYDVDVIRYDDRPHDRHDEVIEHVRKFAPDAIVYIGAIEGLHDRPTLRPDKLKQLRDIAKTIHICGDACDFPWWPFLETYDKEECFDVQVSIDGNYETPLVNFKNGMIKLTPTDPKLFKPRNWHERDIFAAFAGGHGHGERRDLISCLTASMDVQWIRNTTQTNLCESMGRTKISINHSMNGTGDKDHVKGRVVETGFARACLLEKKNKHTSRWFKPGIDYIQYDGVKDAARKLEWAKNNLPEVEKIAMNMNVKMHAEHHPAVFWSDVFEKAGVI
jgi:hypothetical protein